jgi:hypothetical protein
MKPIRNTTAAFLTVLLAVLTTLFAVNAASGQGKCLIVSDIHLTGPQTGGEFKRGDDSNLDFLRNALHEMHKAANDDVSFILIAGDFMGHEVKGSDKAALMAVIAREFHKVFGSRVTIIPAFGNNDTDVPDTGGFTDYTLPSNSFVNSFAASWQLHNKLGVNVDSLKIMHGTYATDIKPSAKSPVFRFVVLNTNVICTQAGDNADGEKLVNQWLPYHLANSKGPVWILSHIPPGGNIFQGYMNGLLHDYTNPAYLDHIKFNIAGHTHFSDFRVLYNQDAGQSKALSFVRIVPSICSNHTNSPAFILADYDKNGNVTAEKTYGYDFGTQTWNTNYGINILDLAGETAAGIMSFLQSPTDAQVAGFNKFHSIDTVNRDRYKTDDRQFLKNDLLEVKP